MTFKDLLKAFLVSVVGPFLFALLTNKYLDFPLDLVTFVNLLVWLIGSFIGGWYLKTKRIEYLKRKFK